MGDAQNKAEQVKGHVKEAVGDVTDDSDLKAEGKRDRAAGSAKETVEKVKDKVDEGIDKVKEKLER